MKIIIPICHRFVSVQGDFGDGLWGIRCSLRINTCEGKREEVEVGKWRNQTGMQVPPSLGREGPPFTASCSRPKWLYLHSSPSSVAGSGLPREGHDLRSHSLLQLRQVLMELTAGGWLLTTRPMGGQKVLPGRGSGQHISKSSTLFYR